MSAIPQPTAFRHSPVSMAPVSSAAERADEQGQRNAPRFRLRVYPTVSRNPYLGLLYGAFEGAEVEMLERVRLMRRFGFMGRADVLHFHWEDGSFWGVKSPWTVRHRLKIVLRMLNRHRAGGGKIVWTVHNEAPHRPGEDHEGFRALRAWLVAHADMVHVHSEAAARMLIESWKADPAKIEVIAHPSYLGVYPQTPGSPPAKVAGKAAFLFFGVYSAYKGGDALRRVFAAPGAEGFVQSLTVAGATPDDEAVRLRDAFAGAEMPVHLRLDRVPDEDVPGLFRGGPCLRAALPADNDVGRREPGFDLRCAGGGARYGGHRRRSAGERARAALRSGRSEWPRPGRRTRGRARSDRLEPHFGRVSCAGR